MTMIETNGRYITLTTAKGKTIEVTLGNDLDSRVFVRVVNSSARIWGVSMGRPFPSLVDAVEHYKNADVKQALRVLISDLV